MNLARGKVDMQIGPHIFPGTTFYEVYYFSSKNNAGTEPPAYAPPPSFVPPPTAISSFGEVAIELVEQVHIAAASDASLASLLQRAVTGRASQEDLYRFGAIADNMKANNATQTTPMISQVQPREFDVVIEFRERPGDRWILPHVPMVCRQESTSNLLAPDIVLSLGVPFTGSPPTEVATLRLLGSPTTLWTMLTQFIGGDDKMEANQKFLNAIVCSKSILHSESRSCTKH
jgi:hypothetical protein